MYNSKFSKKKGEGKLLIKSKDEYALCIIRVTLKKKIVIHLMTYTLEKDECLKVNAA